MFLSQCSYKLLPNYLFMLLYNLFFVSTSNNHLQFRSKYTIYFLQSNSQGQIDTDNFLVYSLKKKTRYLLLNWYEYNNFYIRIRLYNMNRLIFIWIIIKYKLYLFTSCLKLPRITLKINNKNFYRLCGFLA